jgi:hypothetical protein
MTIKYKLGFTIDSEALFGILAKFLPVSDLSVEEVPMVERQLKRADLPELLASIKPKSKRKKARRGECDLTQGVNAIIMGVLADRQTHTYSELRAAIAETTYSANGSGARIGQLVASGYINKLSAGRYRATNKGVPPIAQEEVA